MEVKMKKQLFVLFLVLLITTLFSQAPPDTLWTKTYGGNKDAYLIRFGSEVGVNDHFLPDVTNQHFLYSNFPNPFNPETTISYQLIADSNIDLKVFNIKGQLVEILVNEFKPAGKHSIVWNAENQASGIYFYKLEAGEFEEIRKMILMK